MSNNSTVVFNSTKFVKAFTASQTIFIDAKLSFQSTVGKLELNVNELSPHRSVTVAFKSTTEKNKAKTLRRLSDTVGVALHQAGRQAL